MSNVVLSVIVPTYNERENLRELLERVDRALSGIPYEVIIVDDNSPDGTADLAEELSRVYPVRVVRRSGRLGLASAVLDGFKVSEGKFVAVMDADLQHPPEVLPRLYAMVANGGCDIAIASRYVEGGRVEGWPFFRRFMSWGATLIARTLLPRVRGVRDPMSGYFMFRRKVVEGVISEMNPKGFKILLEILVKGVWREACEVPYTFSVRKRGRSKLGLKEVANYLLHVLELSR